MKTLTYAPAAFRIMNGFFCIYKPAGLHHMTIRKIILEKLCNDLNEMEVRPVKDYVNIEGSVMSGKPFCVSLRENYADHPLVVGARYQPQDFRLMTINKLSKVTSGVMVMAINGACYKGKDFSNQNLLHALEVKGEFGYATDTFMKGGKVKEKATFEKIKRIWMDRLIASIQASQQATAFNYLKVPIESQEAYELASKGMVRPTGEDVPTIIYDIKCTEFNLPHFTLQLQCINPKIDYIAELVHQIGIYLRSCAVCTQIRCTRYGHFTLDHALVRKHWTVEHILTNIKLCEEISQIELYEKDKEIFNVFPKDFSKSSFEDLQKLYYDDLMIKDVENCN